MAALTETVLNLEPCPVPSPGAPSLLLPLTCLYCVVIWKGRAYHIVLAWSTASRTALSTPSCLSPKAEPAAPQVLVGRGLPFLRVGLCPLSGKGRLQGCVHCKIPFRSGTYEHNCPCGYFLSVLGLRGIFLFFCLYGFFYIN